MMSKVLQTGFHDFDEIIEGDCYYVDKTDLICDLLKSRSKSKVYLFTRPRRFGKSLMLSTLDCFFNMKYKGNTWFDGLKVSECRECDAHKNAYPVINVSLKDLYEKDFDTTCDMLNTTIAVTISTTFSYLMGSDRIGEYYRDYCARAVRKELTYAESTCFLKHMCDMLHLHHGVKPIVLIDEYDSPVMNSQGTEHADDVLSMVRTMLSGSLKDNKSLQFAVVTGVMQIAKESIFSGLNNLNVNNVFSKEFDESFGFTDDEVRAMCGYYSESNGRDAAEAFAEAKEWYDGYIFGGMEIYNPWSILKYVSTGFEPRAYWANTSGNAIINSMLDVTDDADWKNLVRLSDGGEVSAEVSDTVTIEDLGDSGSIYSVMVMSGYLKARFEGEDCLLSMPNKEVCREFGRIIAKRIAAKADNVKGFIRAMVSGDAATMKEKLGGILMDNIGGLAFDSERAYNMAISCILIDRDGALSVASEKESGNGRPDIALKSNRAGTPNIIMELKKADPSSSGEKAMDLANEALCQIHDKAYYHGMRGDTILYGISFTGRIPHIAMERISL